MLKLMFSMLAAAALMVGCAPVDPYEEDVAPAASEVFVMPADPTVVLNAIVGGSATYNEVGECLVVGGVNKYPYIDGNDAWQLGDDGLLMLPRAFEFLQTGVPFTDPDTGAKLIQSHGMTWQLGVYQDVYAHLLDP